MSNKPESYPFLRIAKQFNAPYADVLQHADALQHYRGQQIFEPNTEIEIEIFNACLIQVGISDGIIDWQTGEPVRYVAKADDVLRQIRNSHPRERNLGGCPHCGYRHPPDGVCI